MFDQLPVRPSSWRKSTASVLVHAFVLGCIAFHPHPRATRVLLPGTAAGRHLELTYLPGRAPQPTLAHNPKAKPASQQAKQLQQQKLIPPVIEPSEHALVAPPQDHQAPRHEIAAADEHAAPAPHPNATTGSDAQGSGDIQIALTVYSPSPKPDLSHMPHGTQGEVILDVTINPEGKVAELAVLHPLGYGIDDTVLNTVRTWVFHPATENGVPVESVQELHFHYGPV